VVCVFAEEVDGGFETCDLGLGGLELERRGRGVDCRGVGRDWKDWIGGRTGEEVVGSG